MKTFNQTTLYAAVFSILLGGCLMAHSRANGGRLASEANAAMMGLVWHHPRLANATNIHRCWVL